MLAVFATCEEAGSDDEAEEDEGQEDEGDGEDAYLGRPGQAAAGLLPGEDRFMRLREMEAFLEDAEKRETMGQPGENRPCHPAGWGAQTRQPSLGDNFI